VINLKIIEMAQGKKSFVAYADWKEIFDELPNDQAGELIKHIFSYVNDENPNTDSVLIRAVFANIKSTLKRDLDKWESQLEQRRKAGKRSAEIRSAKTNEPSTVVEIRERNPTVNDNVTVNVNDINNNISTKVESDFDFWWTAYDKKTGKEVCLKKWKKLKADEQKKCLEVVEPYVLSTPDKQYRKNPSTYLNGKHWNDETEVNSQSHIPSTLQYERRPIGTTKSMFE